MLQPEGQQVVDWWWCVPRIMSQLIFRPDHLTRARYLKSWFSFLQMYVFPFCSNVYKLKNILISFFFFCLFLIICHRFSKIDRLVLFATEMKMERLHVKGTMRVLVFFRNYQDLIIIQGRVPRLWWCSIISKL